MGNSSRTNVVILYDYSDCHCWNRILYSESCKRQAFIRCFPWINARGAIGNFIDRVFRKEVVDFIHTYIFSYNFPIFNIADSALVIGVILLMLQMLREEREIKEKSYGENGTHHS